MQNFVGAFIGFVLGIVLTLAVVAAGWIAPINPPVNSKEWGEFPANPQSEWLTDGRDMKLLQDFVYIDPRLKVWVATKDSVVNGASIPRPFWPVTGGPLEGQFRNASVVHDAACVRKAEPSQDVHYMFYEACRCGGVSEYQAKVLYAAVYHFGPKWKLRPVSEVHTFNQPDGRKVTKTVTRTVAESETAPQAPAKAVQDKLSTYIKNKNPSLEEIQALNPDSL